jgi:glyoxylase-like metal-dependent hydrolase (beta-lactamase superfamily II)
MTLKFETIVNGPFQENCYLVWEEETKQAIFVDPGDEAQRLIRTARFLGLDVKAVYNTHGHIDHAGAAAAVCEAFGVQFAMHPADAFLLEGLPEQARMFGLKPMAVPRVDRALKDGDTLAVGSVVGQVIHTPGHTPGGVCFRFGGVVLVGDTLFAGSIGRTDLPGGSTRELLASIRDRLLVLPEDTRALSGHGPATSIGTEKEHNPFLDGRWQ